MPRHEHPGEEYAKKVKEIFEQGGEDALDDAEEDGVFDKHMEGWSEDEFGEHLGSCERCQEAMNSLGDLHDKSDEDAED